MKKISFLLLVIFSVNIFLFPMPESVEAGELGYVLFHNNFDNETAGVRPSTTDDNDSLLWTSLNHVRTPEQVVVTKGENGNYLTLKLNEGESKYINPSVIKKIIVTDDCKINISFKLKTNSQKFQLQLYNLDDNNDRIVTKVLNIASSDADFSYYETVSDDGYALVSVDVDFSDMTYSSAFYDGKEISSGKLASATDITNGYYVRFQATPLEECEVYLDDVKITTDKAELLNVKMLDISSLRAESSLMPVLKTSHPRIYVNNFEDIKEKIASDSLSNAWYQKLKSSADGYVSQSSAEEYNSSSQTALATARRIRYKLNILSFMYGLTGNDDYKNQAYNQIIKTGEFPNWNGYLQSAEISGGIAVAYDWLYNGLDSTQREAICDIMCDKGFYYAALSYEGISGTTFVNSPSNQNMACNSLYMLSAIAFANELPDISSYILSKAIASLPKGLAIMAPSGASPEGTGYWDYSMTSVFSLASAIESAISNGCTLPDEYDIASYEGLDNTLYYPIYMQSKNGIFNYGDADNNDDDYYDFSFAYWAAQKYNNPEFFKYQYDNIDSVGDYGTTWRLIHKLCFYNPEFSDEYMSELSLDRAFVSSDGANVASMRSSWDGTGFYAGIQGGSGLIKHMYQSYGNFVLDFDGVRFATMRGRGNYDWQGYFDLDYQKWTYYTARTEGQNCVVLNPDENAGQTLGSTSKIDKFYSSSSESYAVMDLTDAYSDNVHSYMRGIKLFDNRGSVLLQDDIVSNSKISEAYWFMHTDAEITISDDGKSAILAKGGKSITAKIICAYDDAVFSVAEAKPLASSPNPAVQQSTDYGKKLAINISGVQSISLAVLFTPQTSTGIMPEDIIPIEYWGDETKNENTLSYSVYGDNINEADIVFEDSFDDLPSNTFHKYGYSSTIKTSSYAISGFGNTNNLIDNGYINTSYDGNRRFLEFVCKKYCDTAYILGAKLAPQIQEDNKYGSYIIEFDILPGSASEISFFIRSNSFSRIEAAQINGSSSGDGNYNSNLSFGPVLKGISASHPEYEDMLGNLISDSSKWHRVTIIADLDEFKITSLVNGFVVRKYDKDDFTLQSGKTNPGYFDISEFRFSALMTDNSKMAIDNLRIRKSGQRQLISDTVLYNNTYNCENKKDIISANTAVVTKSIINEAQLDADFAVIAASYTDGTLCDIKIKEISLAQNEAYFFRSSLDTSWPDSIVKLFVFDNTNNLYPLTKNSIYHK